MAWIKFTLVTIFWKIFWYTIHFYWQFPFNPTARNGKFLCSANKNAWLCLIDQWKSSIILFWEFVTCRFCLTQCWRRCSNLGTSSSWCWRPGWSRWSRTMTRCWWYWSWWWCWNFWKVRVTFTGPRLTSLVQGDKVIITPPTTAQRTIQVFAIWTS